MVTGDQKDDEVCATAVPDSLITVIQSVQIGPFEMMKMLKDLKPRFIVMYDVDMTTVRQIEVYQARIGSAYQIRVYFMLFGKSVEEQAYLSTLRREKEAFEHLIKEKNNMTITKPIAKVD